MTVPGIAKLSIVMNSNNPRPAKRCRFSSHAVRMPSPAVTGMAINATRSVVSSEFQAEPANTQPWSPRVMAKAVRKYSNVGVLSDPMACTKPPNRMMP